MIHYAQLKHYSKAYNNGTNRTLAEFAMYNSDILVTKDSQQFLRTSANYPNK